jgi:hypothetical protein
MFGFVTERIHSDYASEASSDQSYEEEGKLGNTPRVLLGPCLVDPHYDETQ